jgi:hypothetical protein
MVCIRIAGGPSSAQLAHMFTFAATSHWHFVISINPSMYRFLIFLFPTTSPGNKHY